MLASMPVDTLRTSRTTFPTVQGAVEKDDSEKLPETAANVEKNDNNDDSDPTRWAFRPAGSPLGKFSDHTPRNHDLPAAPSSHNPPYVVESSVSNSKTLLSGANSKANLEGKLSVMRIHKEFENSLVVSLRAGNSGDSLHTLNFIDSDRP